MSEFFPLILMALLNYGMKFNSLQFKTPYSLCGSASLREINHPPFMQRHFNLQVTELSKWVQQCCTLKIISI
ncbi:hypothetical protein FDUTEX481_08914 [Tolypothrix sp. PCC 7601]|nr:hypothetical protein FDUTEX481_08914 [Tolypothrix sp. PCC 7601]